MKKPEMMYTMKLNNKIITDPIKYGSIAKHLNHYYDPNYQTAVWFVNIILRLGTFAIE